MTASPLECAESLEAKLEDRGYKLSPFDRWAIRYISEFRHEFREHCTREEEYLKKVDTALFDPMDGIVHLRAWLKRIFLAIVALVSTLAAIIVWAVNLKSLL